MIAETMHKIGLLKTKPAAWTAYFHAGLQEGIVDGPTKSTVTVGA